MNISFMKYLCFLILLTQCGDHSIPSQVRAKILAWTGSKLEYKVVDFKYLDDPQHMDGKIASIRGGAEIDPSVEDTDVINTGSDALFLQKGSQVKIDHYVEDGVIHHLNQETLEMLSIYYSYEQIVDFFIRNYNFTLEEIGKFNIYFEPSFGAKVEDFKITVTQRLNAAYIAGLGDFLLFKTSPLEHVPIKFNTSILAHEFGHKIFDMRFARKDSKFYETDVSESSKQLSGINEGFADFMAWLFTQKEDMYSMSLPGKTAKYRTLPVAWTGLSLFNNPSVCVGGFYCKGSVLTSALYKLSFATSPNTVGKAVIAALPNFRKDWIDYKNTTDFDYYLLLNRILEQLSSEDQKLACPIFKKWFDDAKNLKGLEKLCR